MAITYSWEFPQMDVYPSFAEQTNVVFTVHWILTGKNDLLPATEASVYGAQVLTYQAGTPFTPFDNLTQEQVASWVIEAMGDDRVTTLKENVEQQIESILNPPTKTLTPPWATEE